MSDDLKPKLPRFNDAQKEWAHLALAVMPPKLAAEVFIIQFVNFQAIDGFSHSEIVEKIRVRFENMKNDFRNKSATVILENQEKMQELQETYLSVFPVFDPIKEMAELQKMSMNDDLKVSERLRIYKRACEIKSEFASNKTFDVEHDWTSEDDMVNLDDYK